MPSAVGRDLEAHGNSKLLRPAAVGRFHAASTLMVAYQVADPDVVHAAYAHHALEGRDMLLTIRFWGLRLRVGVRVGEVYDESREVDGEPVRVFGWGYSTLEGHFEQGTMHYEVWQWLSTGEVEFRLTRYHALPGLDRLSRASASGCSGGANSWPSTVRRAAVCAGSRRRNSNCVGTKAREGRDEGRLGAA